MFWPLSLRVLELFAAMCERERCPYAVIGEATIEQQLVVEDEHFGNKPVDMDMNVLLGKPPRMTRTVAHAQRSLAAFDVEKLELKDAAYRVLRLPTVGTRLS